MGIGARANRYNFLIAYLVTLGSFTYGYDAALIGSVLGLPSFFSYFKIDESSSYGASITGATNADNLCCVSHRRSTTGRLGPYCYVPSWPLY